MPICRFDPQRAMFDVTPVENLFVQEYMLKAPGDFVKVYLYGLMLCYYPQEDMNLTTFAAHLSLTEDAVLSAMNYWVRQGLVRMVSTNPLCCDFIHVMQELSSKKQSDGLYTYREFNQKVQLLFDSRLLSSSEMAKIYDWLEVLKLPQEVIFLLIQTCLQKKGAKVSLAYMDKVAEGWAKDELLTLEKALAYVSKEDPVLREAKSLLRRLGVKNREASTDEKNLYGKWLEDFTPEAIEAACRATTHTMSPSFSYIDGILKGCKGEKAFTPEEITAYLAKEKPSVSKGTPRKKLSGQYTQRVLTPEEKKERNQLFDEL